MLLATRIALNCCASRILIVANVKLVYAARLRYGPFHKQFENVEISWVTPPFSEIPQFSNGRSGGSEEEWTAQLLHTSPCFFWSRCSVGVSLSGCMRIHSPDLTDPNPNDHLQKKRSEVVHAAFTDPLQSPEMLLDSFKFGGSFSNSEVINRLAV